MEKEKIIKTFLEKGHQLDPKVLEFFSNNPEKLDIFLDKTKVVDVPTTITLEFVKSLLERKFEVLKKFEFGQPGKTFTVEDMSKYFTMRYETLRKYLAGRLELVNLISINKISPKTKKFSLIVMVKDKTDKSILVEDSTGETTVYVQEPSDTFSQIVLDEVIGIVCEKEEDVINVKKIIFPDIPLKLTTAKTEEDVYAFFISDIFLDRENNSKRILNRINGFNCDKLYVFVLGNVSSKKEDIINFFDGLPKHAYKIFLRGEIDPDVEVGDATLSYSSLIKIENSVIVLICNGRIFSEYKNIWKGQSSENIMLNLLKKRHLNPVFDFNKRVFNEDVYIIDTVPDIFVSSNFNKPGYVNYKGTTIISNGSFLSEPIYWLINLKTRETIKIDLLRE